MNTLFMLMTVMSAFAVPVCLVLWLVKLALRKPGKRMLKRMLVSVGCCFGFFVLFGLTMEKCQHEYELVETVAETCEEDGYEKYRCSLCGGEKAEKLEKLGHDMEDGACVRCGCVEAVKETESKKEAPEKKADVTVEDEPIYGLYDVLEQIGIDRKDAKKVEKMEDWRLGP